MILRYTTLLEDMVAFNRFLFERSPELRVRLRRNRWLAAFAGWGACLIVCLALKPAFPAGVDRAVQRAFGLLPEAMRWPLALGFLSVLTGFICHQYYQRRFVNKVVRRIVDLHTKGPGRRSLGDHSLELTGAGLKHSGAFGEELLPYKDIKETVRAGRYTFIFLGPDQALCVCHARINEGDPKRFCEALEARRQGW